MVGRSSADRNIAPGSELTLAEIEGPGRITHIWFTIASQARRYPRLTTLRIYYDGSGTPAVEAPLGDFFAVGHGMRRLYENAFGTSEAAWKDASPRHHVAAAKGIPPLLFFHTGRRMAGEKLSNELVGALRRTGTPAQAIHAADKDHAGINRCVGQPGDPHTEVIMQFLADPHRAGTLASRPAAKRPAAEHVGQ